MAWSIVGVGSVVEVTATTHTLTEPAGVAAGDLLVACIGSRIASTTSIALPSGWKRVREQLINNIVAGATGQASACMAFIVRGASAPALTFTHPAAPNVARGQIVAYRENTAGNSLGLDAAGGNSSGTSITAISLIGSPTTTVGNDLLVGMLAGGSAATYTAFKTANAPSTASGATNTSSAPSTTTWTERADASSATGADLGLGVFDAVKTATGSCGTVTATASVASGHTFILGAFVSALSTADAWNSVDKTSGITLSNSDKTATGTSSQGVRSTTKYTNGTAGKYYAEFKISGSSVPGSLGLIDDSASLITTAGAFAMGSSGFIDPTSIDIGTPVQNDVVCMAWDAGAERIWFRLNGGIWNNSGTADPATGAEGIDASAAAATPHALWMRVTGSSQIAIIRTELAEYTQTIPSGFKSWMGETPAGGTGVTVNVTGQAVSAAVGDVTVSTPAAVGVNVDLVGQGVTASVGTPTVTAATGISTLAAGQEVITAVGQVSASGKSNVSTIAAGQTTTAGVGQVGVTAIANVSTTATGQEVASAVGQVSVSAVFRVDVSTTATGQAVTAAVGDVSVTGKANVSTLLAGQAVTAAAGQLTVAAQIGVSVPVVSETITSAVGIPSITTHARFTVAGQAVTSAVSFVTVGGATGISVLAAGQQVTSAVGAPTITTQQKFTVTGQEVIASGRGVSVSAGGSVSITASSGLVTSGVGQVGVNTTHKFSVTGTESTAAVGQVTVDARQTVSNTVVGQSLAVALSPVTVTAGRSVSVLLAGQSVASAVGSVNVSLGIGVTVSLIGQEIAAEVGRVTFPITIDSPMPGMWVDVGTVTVTTGDLRGMDVWTGTAWVGKPTKVWTGSAWVAKPVKVWNGSLWA